MALCPSVCISFRPIVHAELVFKDVTDCRRRLIPSTDETSVLALMIPNAHSYRVPLRLTPSSCISQYEIGWLIHRSFSK